MADLLPASDIARLDVPEADVRVAAWNLANPIGTWVVAYPGARGDRHVITRTRAEAALSRNGRPVVWLEGYDGYLRLEDVIAITQKRAGQLLEQDHQIFDLDADSKYSIPGAVYGSYLNLGGAA